MTPRATQASFRIARTTLSPSATTPAPSPAEIMKIPTLYSYDCSFSALRIKLARCFITSESSTTRLEVRLLLNTKPSQMTLHPHTNLFCLRAGIQCCFCSASLERRHRSKIVSCMCTHLKLAPTVAKESPKIRQDDAKFDSS